MKDKEEIIWWNKFLFVSTFNFFSNTIIRYNMESQHDM